MNTQLPVTIFTGFLGAGKTTLLKTLLPEFGDHQVAVIINELGETSIDGALFAAQAHSHRVPELHEITGRLIGTSSDDELDHLLAHFEARVGEIDHLFIETSGLSVPDSLINKLQGSTPASSPFTIDATAAVIDVPHLLYNDRTALPRFPKGAPTFTRLLNTEDAEREVFNSQVSTADVVIFNKIDELTSDEILHAESLIRSAVPTVRFIELAHHGHIAAALVTGLFLNKSADVSRHQLSLVPVARPHTHSHSGLDNHEHGIRTHEHLHDHNPNWMAIQLTSTQTQPADLASVLENLSSKFPLMRIKGNARLDSGHDVHVQAVRNRVHITSHSHHHDHAQSRLVLIGYDINRTDIACELSNLTATSWN